MDKHDIRDDENNHRTGTWVLITSGPARILGRVNRLDFEDVSKEQEVKVADVMKAGVITLMPAYDFFAPLRPVPVMRGGVQQMEAPGIPKMGMARDPIVTGRDFALKPYPVHIKTGGGFVCDFISQMDVEDQGVYRNFAEAAAKAAREQEKDREQQTTEAAAKRMGIILPNRGKNG